MAFDPENPVARLDAALAQFVKQWGGEAALELLAREGDRIRAILRAEESERLNVRSDAAPPPAGEPEPDEDEAVQRTIAALSEACEFYEKPANYRRQGGRPAAVIVDGGSRAREALNMVYGDERGGGND